MYVQLLKPSIALRRNGGIAHEWLPQCVDAMVDVGPLLVLDCFSIVFEETHIVALRAEALADHILTHGCY